MRKRIYHNNEVLNADDQKIENSMKNPDNPYNIRKRNRKPKLMRMRDLMFVSLSIEEMVRILFRKEKKREDEKGRNGEEEKGRKRTIH